MKKAVAILASPRKNGNSATLADRAMEGIRDEGGACESICLNRLHIRPCQACGFCQREKGNKCAIKDDMYIVYEALAQSDILLIASPIYMFTVSAQLKLFMDRCYAVPALLRDKKVGVLLTYGDTDEYTSGAINAINTIRDEYRYKHAELIGILHGSANKRGEIAQNTRLMDEACQLGHALVSA